MAVTSPNDTVIAELRDSVCHVTLNRPKALNALTPDLVAALNHVLSEISIDPSIRCVVLSGAGAHFMAGGDVKSFKRVLDEKLSGATLQSHFSRLLNDFHQIIATMRAMRQPILASVRGATAGAGVGLMLGCDMVIAADDAFFNLAYCHLGVSPDGGSTYALPRVVGSKRAFEIALLGERFDAATAERWGLINRVVVRADLAVETSALAGRLADGPSRAHGNAKALLNASLNSTLDGQLKAETEAFVDCVVSADFTEGVNAFIEKRSSKFKSI